MWNVLPNTRKYPPAQLLSLGGKCPLCLAELAKGMVGVIPTPILQAGAPKSYGAFFMGPPPPPPRGLG